MRQLSERAARDLVRILQNAEEAVREHAAEQSYRSTACRHVRERILATYHHDKADAAIELAQRISEARADLETIHRQPRAVPNTG